MPRGRTRIYQSREEKNAARQLRRQTQATNQSLSDNINHGPYFAWQIPPIAPSNITFSHVPPAIPYNEIEPHQLSQVLPSDDPFRIPEDEIISTEEDDNRQIDENQTINLNSDSHRSSSLNDLATSPHQISPQPNSLRPVIFPLEVTQSQDRNVETPSRDNTSILSETENQNNNDNQKLAKFLTRQFLEASPSFSLCPSTDDNEEENISINEDSQAIPSTHESASRTNNDRIGVEDILDQWKRYLDKELPDIISNNNIGGETEEYIEELTTDQRNYIFSGPTSSEYPTINERIDPTLNNCADAALQVEFDIDSILVVVNRLDAIKQDISWYLAPLNIPNLTSNLHLSNFPVQYTDQSGYQHQIHVPIPDIPNYCFGRLDGADDITLNFLFPRLYTPRPKLQKLSDGRRLTDQQLEDWTNNVVLPALKASVTSARLQHYPGSFHHALYNSRAKGTESKKVKANRENRIQGLKKEVPSICLGTLYQEIQARLESPQNIEFCGVFIFAQGKGLKLKHWKSSSFTTTADLFNIWLQQSFDLALIPHTDIFVDIGRETVQTISLSQQHPSTLIWQKQFFDKLFQRLESFEQSKLRIKSILYPWGFLRDTVAGTLETPIGSSLRKDGLYYLQYYHSFKEIFSAGNTYPFANTALGNACIDPQTLALFQSVGGAISADPSVLWKAYLHSKLRAHYGLQASDLKYFGLRQEVRVSLSLFRTIVQEARGLSPLSQPILVTQLDYCVSLPTTTACRWFRWNLNRLCYGLEYIFALTKARTRIPWESTRLMILFLESISCFIGNYIPGTYPHLWLGEYKPYQNPMSTHDIPDPEDPQTRHGLGLGVNIEKYGFAWFLPKVDWASMTIIPEFRLSMGRQNLLINNLYLKHYHALKHVIDTIKNIDIVGIWLQKWSSSQPHLKFLGSYLRLLCIRAFYIDVFDTLLPNIKKKYQKSARDGKLGLCFETLTEIFQSNASIKFSHHSQNRVKNFHALFQYLWGEDMLFLRGAWRVRPFRFIYSSILHLLQQQLGRSFTDNWKKEFKQYFQITCWFIPYPCNQHLVARTKTRKNGQPRVEYRFWSCLSPRWLDEINPSDENTININETDKWIYNDWNQLPETEKYLPGKIQIDFTLAEYDTIELEQRLNELSDSEHTFRRRRSSTIHTDNVASTPILSLSPNPFVFRSTVEGFLKSISPQVLQEVDPDLQKRIKIRIDQFDDTLDTEWEKVESQRRTIQILLTSLLESCRPRQLLDHDDEQSNHPVLSRGRPKLIISKPQREWVKYHGLEDLRSIWGLYEVQRRIAENRIDYLNKISDILEDIQRQLIVLERRMPNILDQFRPYHVQWTEIDHRIDDLRRKVNLYSNNADYREAKAVLERNRENITRLNNLYKIAQEEKTLNSSLDSHSSIKDEEIDKCEKIETLHNQIYQYEREILSTNTTSEAAKIVLSQYRRKIKLLQQQIEQKQIQRYEVVDECYNLQRTQQNAFEKIITQLRNQIRRLRVPLHLSVEDISD